MSTKQKVGWAVVSVLVLIYALFPVASILMTSFKTPADLTSGKFLPTDWVARQVARLDRTEGDIDALMARIAGTRTWTYVSHRAGWLDDAAHWQERSRALEDKLSDALHDRLTQRFVDRRAAVLVRRLRDGGDLLGAVTRAGDVLVEGEHVGRLNGFRFAPDEMEGDMRPLMNAAQRVLRGEIGARVKRLGADPDETFSLDAAPAGATLLWNGEPVARLGTGATALTPRVELLPAELLDGAHRREIGIRLEAWIARHIARELEPLTRLRDAELTGSVRGLAYQIVEWLGVVPRPLVERQVAPLGRADRRALAELGVRIGSETIFMPALMRGRATRLRALLWAVKAERTGDPALPPSPGKRTTMLTADPAVPADYYAAINFRVLAGRAFRADRLERLADVLRALSRQGPFELTPALLDLAGGPAEEVGPVLGALGYHLQPGDPPTYVRRKRFERPPGAGKTRRAPRPRQRVDLAASPFASLRNLDLGGRKT